MLASACAQLPTTSLLGSPVLIISTSTGSAPHLTAARPPGGLEFGSGCVICELSSSTLTESNSDAASAIGDQGPQRSRDTKCGMTPSLISALFVSKMLFTVLISLCTSTSSKTSSNLQMEDSVRHTSIETEMRSADESGGVL